METLYQRNEKIILNELLIPIQEALERDNLNYSLYVNPITSLTHPIEEYEHINININFKNMLVRINCIQNIAYKNSYDVNSIYITTFQSESVLCYEDLSEDSLIVLHSIVEGCLGLNNNLQQVVNILRSSTNKSCLDVERLALIFAMRTKGIHPKQIGEYIGKSQATVYMDMKKAKEESQRKPRTIKTQKLIDQIDIFLKLSEQELIDHAKKFITK